MGVIHNTATATIASGQTTSPAVFTGQKIPTALQMPAAFTGASVSFQGSADNVTYQDVYLGNALYSELVTAGKNVVLSQSAMAAFPYIKIVSASAEGADRVIIIITRRVGK